MGIIWRSAMPLLTTLAALVIIVHCVEEDFENEYRHDLRPRIMESATSYDQLWRAIEEDPVIPQPRHTDSIEDRPQEEPPKRRRPGRKRKRRPQAPPTEDLEPRERFTYFDEPPRPYYDVDFDTRQTTEMPPKRRRKTESRPIRWTDDEVMVVERPLRRRAMERKKRPSLDSWPRLSEFRQTNDQEEEVKPESEFPADMLHAVSPSKDIAGLEHIGELARPRPAPLKLTSPDTGIAPADEENDAIAAVHNNDDKSLSDFSLEAIADVRATNPEHKAYKKYMDKTAGAFNAEDKVKEKISQWYQNIVDPLEVSDIITVVDEKIKIDMCTYDSDGSVDVLKCGEKVYGHLIDIDQLSDHFGEIESLAYSKSKYKTLTSGDFLKAVSKDVEGWIEEPEPDIWISEIHTDKGFHWYYLSKEPSKATTKKYNKRTKKPKLAKHAMPTIFKTLEQLKGFEKVHDKIDDNKLSELDEKRQNLIYDKSKHKTVEGAFEGVLNEPAPAFWMDDIIMDTNPVNQLTLKDILKRSNGTSLSEILQQHNLSLTDLLHGKEHAVSIFKYHESLDAQNKNDEPHIKKIFANTGNKEESEQVLINSESKYATELPTESYTTAETAQTEEPNKSDGEAEKTATSNPSEGNAPRISAKRRYPPSLRKKLRMRPLLNVTNTYKGQLSRDLIALNARKYSRRNTTKSKEWKDVVSSMRKNNTSNSEYNKTTPYETTTTAMMSEETTFAIESNNNIFEAIRPEVAEEMKLDDINMDDSESTASVTVTEISTEIPKNVTDKPVVVTMARPTAVSTGLRRQAFNNRLKRKRLKHKNLSTESPQDDIIKHLFGLGNLVSSSEFIARTEEPKTTVEDSKELTTLEDITTTSTTKTVEPKYIKTISVQVTTPKSISPITTEESAKVEIDEILNDTQTSAKLSRILMERNMTLLELVEHRERGSSHVHLADIFHNASREPNPPEPFLSKSLIEPISKETYPLRALLDANSHDPNGKVTTMDPNVFNNINIPVVMDFRNNVNENAENMGIMSLFNNFTKNSTKNIILPEPERRREKVSETTTNVPHTNDTVRESRVLGEVQDDIVSWNEIFSLMGRTRNNETEEFASMQPFKKITIEDDADGDGVLVLEDLQHLKDFENNIASGSDEDLEVNSFEKEDKHLRKGSILDKIPSQTKSVTVATACIAGLAMILFLLTYAAFKWKQQRSMIRQKRSLGDDRIPTPVFENRKGHKNHSSTRSMSPMLQTSNIYTLNTLDSQNGKESPDYMWDSLRKPFQ